MRKLTRAVLALLAAAVLAPAFAQSDYPRQPIRLVVTFPPGGSADGVVRMLLPRINARLGQNVIVDNKPGAGGNIGLAIVSKAPADGYTMGVGAAGALAANSSLYPRMPYDVQKDFRPVAMLAGIPFVLVGNPDLPTKDVKSLVAAAKAAPGRFSIAHGGNGTAMHLSAALFAQQAGVKLVEVPYKGSGPAALDALSGQVQLAMVDLPASLQQIKAGKLVAYAVTSPKRLPQLPDVPTFAEAGLKGYDSVGWFGIVAPTGTPTMAVARVNAAVNDALADPAVQASLRNLGVEPAPQRPEAFDAYIRTETVKWAKVIKQGNIKLE